MSTSSTSPAYVGRPTNPDALITEAWGQGLMVGSLVLMSAITIANMRRRVILHKLILAEVYPLSQTLYTAIEIIN
jgi:hypothetical protein